MMDDIDRLMFIDRLDRGLLAEVIGGSLAHGLSEGIIPCLFYFSEYFKKEGGLKVVTDDDFVSFCEIEIRINKN